MSDFLSVNTKSTKRKYFAQLILCLNEYVEKIKLHKEQSPLKGFEKEMLELGSAKLTCQRLSVGISLYPSAKKKSGGARIIAHEVIVGGLRALQTPASRYFSFRKTRGPGDEP